jgi:PHD/YefM family antitoxin component YafN of YafNO toxin-antitoxin module
MMSKVLTKPKIILENNKPSGVILDWKDFQEILEKIEDIYDLSEIKKMKKMKFRKFDDFLKEYGLRNIYRKESRKRS